MGLKSLRLNETEKNVTLPNAISVIRGVGGIALGIGLAKETITPKKATIFAALLAASDAEGSLITATKRLPDLQKILRIIPSRAGRNLDPIMDKVFAMAVLVGGGIGGQIPKWQAASIIATETATSASSAAAKLRHTNPEASKIGKIGMVARCGAIVADLAVDNVAPNGLAHDILTDTSNSLAIIATGLGAISCGQLIKRAMTGDSQVTESLDSPA